MIKRKIVSEKSSFRDGVRQLCNVVGSTYGPGGRTVLIDRKGGQPFITKDGVTVSRNFDLKDEIMNLPVSIIKESAERTLKNAGDGTTTTTILACNMYMSGHGDLYGDSGERKRVNATEYSRGMQSAVASILPILDTFSKEISGDSDIFKVAMVSTNSDEKLSNTITKAFVEVGGDGVIIGEEHAGQNDEVVIERGYTFDEGYMHPSFVTNKSKMIVEYDDALVLVVENTIPSLKHIEGILKDVIKAKRPLLIIAKEYDNSVAPNLSINKLSGTLDVVSVLAPGVGDDKNSLLKDIAAYCGATSINSNEGTSLLNIKIEHLGLASKVIVTSEGTTIIRAGEESPSCKERIDNLRKYLEHHNPSTFEKMKVEKRLGQLNGVVAKVLLSANSSSEFREKKDRFDDAIEACRSAIKHGVVAGSTATILYMAIMADTDLTNRINDGSIKESCFTLGYRNVISALYTPTFHLLMNAGHSFEDVELFIRKVGELYSDTDNENFGYGFTIDPFTTNLNHMDSSNIIDPTMVIRESIINAVSTSSTLLTSDYALVTDQ